MKERLLPEFLNKKVLIWGMGREGNSTYNVIRSLCKDQLLYICDSNLKDKDKYENVEFVEQDTLNFDDYDIIMKAPGIVCKDHPAISGETPLFLKYFKDQIVGITGTKGKSTTSTLTYHLLHSKIDNCFFVGNIGLPCFEILDEMNENSVIVFELGCHQLEFTKDSPHIGVILNVFEEHLDHYKTYERYFKTKYNCVKYQRENDIAIISEEFDDNITANKYIAGKDITNDYHTLVLNGERIDIEYANLQGLHNYYNMSIASFIAKHYGLTNEEIIEGIKTFKPLSYRLETFATYNGVTFVDDSISTINEACIQALESLKNVKTVIIGGMDRGIDYSKLESYLNTCNVENIILMYATGKRIYEEMKDLPVIERCILTNDLKEAVDKACEVTHEGVCVMSPAAASYDHFKNFEQRGTIYKQLVKEHYEH